GDDEVADVVPAQLAAALTIEDEQPTAAVGRIDELGVDGQHLLGRGDSPYLLTAPVADQLALPLGEIALAAQGGQQRGRVLGARAQLLGYLVNLRLGDHCPAHKVGGELFAVQGPATQAEQATSVGKHVDVLIVDEGSSRDGAAGREAPGLLGGA